MATSLIPDPNNPATPASSAPLTPETTPPQESQSPPIPPTNPPAEVPTETAQARYTRILEETLRENNRRLQQQQDEIAGLRRAPETAPTPPATPDASTFFNNPGEVLQQFENRIKSHLDATVKPLQDFVQSMKGEGTPYGNLKQQLASDPSFARHLANPKISLAVDKILEGQQNISRELMSGAIIQAAGLAAVDQLDIALVRSGVDITRFNTPTPTPQPQPEMRITPPHIAPSAPPAPTNQPAVEQPQYTENEKRIMRERGWKPGDGNWEKWLGITPNEVTTKNFGGNK